MTPPVMSTTARRLKEQQLVLIPVRQPAPAPGRGGPSSRLRAWILWRYRRWRCYKARVHRNQKVRDVPFIPGKDGRPLPGDPGMVVIDCLACGDRLAIVRRHNPQVEGG